ncbi:MAG: multicopper oxidase family protein [Anaerolineales bacterium]
MSNRQAFSRRSFLKAAVLGGLATASCRAFGNSAPASTSTAVPRPDVEIALTTHPVEWELAPGKVITAWTYNGSLPGETIRVREGQRVRVTLKNELLEPTTIHWHGIDVPSNMDGVPDLSQPPVQPGETFVYEFDARPAGTRWYHTHYNSAVQMDAGLSAPFIIEPVTPETTFDREFTLVLDDWVTDASVPTPGSDSDMGGMMGGMMGDPGPAYDTFTINGKAFPATELLRVKRGERIRLRFINVSNMQTFVIALAGHHLQVIHTDGNPLQSPVEVDAIPIAPAERYDVVFTADSPGKWPLYGVDGAHRNGGLKTLLIYDGEESMDEAPIPDPAELTVWTYEMGEGVDTLPSASGQAATYDLTLSGGMGMMGQRADEWTINDRVYPDTETIKAGQNQLVRARLFNMSMQAHPFHLHGQSFRVLSMGDQTLAKPLIKDTLDVAAMMGTAEIEFVAFNPGDWMFHCHKPMHMDGGMAMLVKIT